MIEPVDPIETPDAKIAQHVGWLTLRVIALEHERELLMKQIARLTPKKRTVKEPSS